MVMMVVVEKVMVEMVILINCFRSVMLSCHSLKWVPNIWELRQVITLRKGRMWKKIVPFDPFSSIFMAGVVSFLDLAVGAKET